VPTSWRCRASSSFLAQQPLGSRQREVDDFVLEFGAGLLDLQLRVLSRFLEELRSLDPGRLDDLFRDATRPRHFFLHPFARLFFDLAQVLLVLLAQGVHPLVLGRDVVVLIGDLLAPLIEQVQHRPDGKRLDHPQEQQESDEVSEDNRQ
jgi:hypothetical protein